MSCAPRRPPPRPTPGTRWPRPSPPATTPTAGPPTAARAGAAAEEARRAAEGGLRATLERVESESALRARADAEAGRLRTELEAARAELSTARLRALPPDELRALLVDALAARPPADAARGGRPMIAVWPVT